ncbi:MAG TPA: CBS domain-containing protein [Noviherbaspirillum sp.]|nr:CBS domain-containing protein [Noviherbaspirillum sp.]
MQSVAHILESKRHQRVHTIAPHASVLQALTLMAEMGIGALLVMENERVVGIMSERDYARKVELKGRTAKDTTVAEIMTRNVIYVRPHQTNEECMALMTEGRLRHLPVMDDGKLVGLISIGDLVADIISEQQFTIEQLQHYIQGDRA